MLTKKLIHYVDTPTLKHVSPDFRPSARHSPTIHDSNHAYDALYVVHQMYPRNYAPIHYVDLWNTSCRIQSQSICQSPQSQEKVSVVHPSLSSHQCKNATERSEGSSQFSSWSNIYRSLFRTLWYYSSFHIFALPSLPSYGSQHHSTNLRKQ